MSLRDIQPQADPMMDELRKIRDDIGAHLLSLSPGKRSDWVNHEAETIAGEHGYELRPHPTLPNCKQLVRKA
jgi:hypothetical protein